MNLPVLNLLNFEHPRAKKCKYVLTSPRSLKACRKAGIKPIELLCKSISDVEKEIQNKDEAYIIYQANEKERQRKLSICRAIRNQFLLFGYSDSKHKRHSPKLYYKDRLLPVLADNVMRNNTSTPENKRRPSSTTYKTPKVVTLSEAPERSRLCLPVPKMNINYEGKTDKSESWNITSKELKVKLPGKTPPGTVSTERKTTQVQPQTYEEEKAKNQKFNNADLDIMKNLNYDKLSREILEKENKTPGSIWEENDSEIAICDVNNNYNYCDEKQNCNGRRNKETKKYKKSSEYKNLFQFMKMEYADPLYCVQKYKKVIENSIDRELRELEVHRVQRELEEGMERWQDRVLLLQWVDLTRAGEQASRELEQKVERAHQKNRSKHILHTININRVKEAEDIKAEGLRKQVQDKERKILNLHEEKKRVIFESKSRAQSVTELKDHIRSIMTPETFDRKVAKLGMEKKVLNSQMCPRVMQSSHIWLG